jgi:hypothetical protein
VSHACIADKFATCYGLKNVGLVVKLGASRLTKSRVLVCAPSNAALDEIVLRVLRLGLRDGAGKKVVPSIVRAGVAARMHSSIRQVTLEALVSQVVGEGADSREVCHLFSHFFSWPPLHLLQYTPPRFFEPCHVVVGPLCCCCYCCSCGNH